MCKKNLLSLRLYFWGALFLAITTFAQVASPSKEFWDYMEEFGDQNGNLLDPLEYDLIASVKSDGSLLVEDEQDAKQEQSIEQPIVKFKNRNSDMKIEQQSSSQRSSAVIKGAQQ